MLLSLYFTGCTKQEKNNPASSQETQDHKIKSDIREIAYKYLGESDKETLIDFENAEVEEYIYTTDHFVAGLNGKINIKDKDTYRVVFNTINDAILGPITIYIDKSSYYVLGIDFRD